MGATFSSMFGMTDEEQPVSEEHLQLSDLGGFLSKYIFIMLDKDKSKLVSKSEYLTLVNHFREQKTSEEELDNFLEKHVGEGNSTEYIDEILFKKLIVQLAVDFDRNIVERMKYLMTLFDKDGDGFVSELDLCEVYDAIGIQVPMDPIKCLITKFDVDGDGKLSVEEFEQLGRSAMNKLFIRKEVSPREASTEEAEALVDEAIQRATGVGKTGKKVAFCGFGDSVEVDPDLLNNNYAGDSAVAFGAGNKIGFGKPVELNDGDASQSVIVGETLKSVELDQNQAEEESLLAGTDGAFGETVVDNV